VTIERIDRDESLVEYRTADRRRVVRRVWQKNLLDGLRVGDIVEVTFTIERAIHVERRRE